VLGRQEERERDEKGRIPVVFETRDTARRSRWFIVLYGGGYHGEILNCRLSDGDESTALDLAQGGRADVEIGIAANKRHESG